MYKYFFFKRPETDDFIRKPSVYCEVKIIIIRNVKIPKKKGGGVPGVSSQAGSKSVFF